MSKVIDTLPRRAPIMQRCWHGYFAADVRHINDYAKVILPDFNPHLVWEGCRWQPRVAIIIAEEVDKGNEGITMPDFYASVLNGLPVAKVMSPLRKDTCIVEFDNQRQPWVICWWIRNMDERGARG